VKKTTFFFVYHILLTTFGTSFHYVVKIAIPNITIIMNSQKNLKVKTRSKIRISPSIRSVILHGSKVFESLRVKNLPN
jgi:hypothetical protein